MTTYTDFVIYCPSGISETVFGTPVAAAIKESAPGAHVTWIAQPKVKDFLISVCPGIDDVVEIRPNASPEQALEAIKKLQPQVVINLSDHSLTKSWVNKITALWSKPSFLEIEILREADDDHVVDQYLECLSQLNLPIPKHPFPTVFPEALRSTIVEPVFDALEMTVEEPVIGIVPGVGADFTTRAWLTDGWCYLIRSINEHLGVKCLLLGGPNDVAVCEEIVTQVPDMCKNLAGKLTLVESAAVIKALALVIGGDCGIIHVAVAASTPTIGLFGPTSSARYGPYGESDLVLDQHKRCECVETLQCQRLLNSSGNCMRAIQLSEVLEKIFSVLGNGKDKPPPPRDSDNWFWKPKRDAYR